MHKSNLEILGYMHLEEKNLIYEHGFVDWIQNEFHWRCGVAERNNGIFMCQMVFLIWLLLMLKKPCFGNLVGY